MGYNSPEDFFKKNAFAIQELANERVGNILERIFSTSALHLGAQEQLKKFTYKAIDHLRLNDSVIYQSTRNGQTSYNNGRNDSIQSENNSLEALVGNAAWRSWVGANIEVLYTRYLNENNITWLLDPEQFYTKLEIDKFLEEIDWKIQEEHTYTTINVAELHEKINRREQILQQQINQKQEIIDQKLLQQKTDEDGNVTGEIEELGYFDEIMFQSNRPSNYIVENEKGKKRAVININETIGEIANATVYQTTSETDQVNAIGRVWGKGIENTKINALDGGSNLGIDHFFSSSSNIYCKNLTNSELKTNAKSAVEAINELLNYIKNPNNRFVKGQYLWTDGSDPGPGWIRQYNDSIYRGLTLLIDHGNPSGGIVSGEIKEHKHTLGSGRANWFPTCNTMWNYSLFTRSGSSLVPTYSSHNGVEFFSESFTMENTGGAYNKAAGIYAALWKFIGVNEKGETINDNVNFKIPYWEKQRQEEEENLKKEKELQEIAKKSDLEPIKQKLENLVPTVKELEQKDRFRMEKLGVDPNSKYWEKGDKNE